MREAWTWSESRKKRRNRVLLVILCTIMLWTYNWNYEAEREAHTVPTVQKCNIYQWVKMRRVPLPILRLLSEQTGVDDEVVASLLEQGYWQQLLDLQEAYFALTLTVSEKSSPLTVSEYLVDESGSYTKGTRLIDVRKGDILITKNSRFLGWRNGHAGIVVDAEKGLVLEAIMPGTDTKLCRLQKWEEYPSFQVLRLKEEVNTIGIWNRQWELGSEKEDAPGSLSVAGRAADYASEYLVDIPYQLLAGVWERALPLKAATVHASEGKQAAVMVSGVKGTQCAHLVWCAYKQAGIDLDSDGGIIVTPYDIQNSPYLEVIQSYGY